MIRALSRDDNEIPRKHSPRMENFHIFFNFAVDQFSLPSKRLNLRISDNLVLHAYLKNKMNTTNTAEGVGRRRKRTWNERKLYEKLQNFFAYVPNGMFLTLFNRSSVHIRLTTTNTDERRMLSPKWLNRCVHPHQQHSHTTSRANR